MSEQIYTQEFLRDLVEVFKELEAIQAALERRKAALLETVIGEPVRQCEKCLRPMLPRRIWDLLPKQDRPTSCARSGDDRMCLGHLIRERETNGTVKHRQLPTRELHRLRKQVGLE
jgi:hypothetical protein